MHRRDVLCAKADPHKIIITLSNLFTTPMATGVPVSWKNLTPVSMMALDQFVLWVNAETPYKTAKEYIEAVKKAGPNKMKMGGTGSKQEDQILTVSLEKATGTKFNYLPFKGGGDVAVVGCVHHGGSGTTLACAAAGRKRRSRRCPAAISRKSSWVSGSP